MSDLVDPAKIEDLVGAKRHTVQHLARAVSAEKRVYILHSQKCLDSGIDLRDCPYSEALDKGIKVIDWQDREDQPVALAIYRTHLLPLTPDWLETS